MIFSAKNTDWRVLVSLLILICATAIAFRLIYFGTERLLSEDTVFQARNRAIL